MAIKENDQQLELFAQNTEAHSPRASGDFIRRLWNYEKGILLILTLIVTGIVAFSLGVEKGKRISLANKQPVAAAKQIVPQVSNPAQDTREETSAEDTYQGFTIQLASYRTRSFAEREAQSLKAKGLAPLVLSKGNYAVLCVGNFSDKEQAQGLLTQLRKRYADCRIRRL
jgi:hypothetical protein